MRVAGLAGGLARYVLTWMKLRLMLKLHSALVELDSKLCSLRRFLVGILYVIIQQYADQPSDSVREERDTDVRGK